MIRRLELRSFRNYEHAEVDFTEGVHLVVGPNAQGKTNLLESLYLLGTGRLLRGIRDAECVRQGDGFALVNGWVDPGDTEISVRIEAGVRKKVTLNSVSLLRPSDLLGRLPCVVFSTFDLAIVREDAKERRLFMDTELSQLYPNYLRSLAGYKRALEQRNALLKQAQEAFVQRALFEPWEVELAKHGSVLRFHRTDFLSRIGEIGSRVHAELSDGEVLAVRYVPHDDALTPQDMAAVFENSHAQDVRRGTTTSGPHRDDFLLEIGGKEARLFGSQGQQRTAAVALKLAVMENLSEILSVRPLILLDDVLSELDQDRRQQLIAWVRDAASQTVVTCTEIGQVGQELADQSKIIRVFQGTLQED